MSDIEEPPAKITRIELVPSATDTTADSMEDGQEEWLSEEVLTDDDYNPDNTVMESNPGNIQEETLQSTADSDATNVDSKDSSQDEIPDKDRTQDQTIENALNTMDAQDAVQSELPDLDAFLIRKVDGKVVDSSKKADGNESDVDASVKQSDDDGNDTDDLLRMLGDDEKVKKDSVRKMVKSKKGTEEDDASTDDEYIFDGSKVTTLKVAQNVLIRKKPAKKAEPEDMSDREDTDTSDDADIIMTKMFGVKKGPVQTKDSTKTDKTAGRKDKPIVKHVINVPTKEEPRKRPVTRHVVNIEAAKKASSRPATVNIPVTSTPLRQYTNKNIQNKMSAKDQSKNIQTEKQLIKQVEKRPERQTKKQPVKQVEKQPEKIIKKQPEKHIEKQPEKIIKKQPQKHTEKQPEKHTKKYIEKQPTKEPARKKEVPKEELEEPKEEPEEIINEQEFLEDDNFDLDEDFAEESDEELEARKEKQRIMKPEQMDEEVPSDAESYSDEDGSMFDELPSSDSEDIDDWFTFDVRAERAGDYLPLLGANAYKLLTEEKKRVGTRLVTLRQTLSALSESGRQQAEQINKATTTLAELDSLLASS